MSSTYFDSPWFEFLGKRWTNLKVGFLFLRFVFGHFSMLHQSMIIPVLL